MNLLETDLIKKWVDNVLKPDYPRRYYTRSGAYVHSLHSHLVAWYHPFKGHQSVRPVSLAVEVLLYVTDSTKPGTCLRHTSLTLLDGKQRGRTERNWSRVLHTYTHMNNHTFLIPVFRHYVRHVFGSLDFVSKLVLAQWEQRAQLIVS